MICLKNISKCLFALICVIQLFTTEIFAMKRNIFLSQKKTLNRWIKLPFIITDNHEIIYPEDQPIDNTHEIFWDGADNFYINHKLLKFNEAIEINNELTDNLVCLNWYTLIKRKEGLFFHKTSNRIFITSYSQAPRIATEEELQEFVPVFYMTNKNHVFECKKEVDQSDNVFNVLEFDILDQNNEIQETYILVDNKLNGFLPTEEQSKSIQQCVQAYQCCVCYECCKDIANSYKCPNCSKYTHKDCFRKLSEHCCTHCSSYETVFSVINENQLENDPLFNEIVETIKKLLEKIKEDAHAID